MHALTGMSAHEFMELLPAFTAVWEAERIRAYPLFRPHAQAMWGQKGVYGDGARKALLHSSVLQVLPDL